MHFRKKNPTVRPRPFRRYDLVISLGGDCQKTTGYYKTEDNNFVARADRFTTLSIKGVKILLYSMINSIYMLSNVTGAVDRKYRVLIYHSRKHTEYVTEALSFLKEEFSHTCEVKRKSYWR